MSVLQLTRQLTERPLIPAVPGIQVRTFSGVTDIALWLGLRHGAFAREKLGVREWNAADFEREFLAKPWWRPERMWFAELQNRPASSTLVGTVTLALRGEGDAARPVVHWLAVSPSHRRQGIGRLLTATLEAAAWDAGYRQVWLETHSAWAAAKSLYDALGYQPLD
jgi:GNAT superfamily N-acetyltransferase